MITRELALIPRHQERQGLCLLPGEVEITKTGSFLLPLKLEALQPLDPQSAQVQALSGARQSQQKLQEILEAWAAREGIFRKEGAGLSQGLYLSSKESFKSLAGPPKPLSAAEASKRGWHLAKSLTGQQVQKAAFTLLENQKTGQQHQALLAPLSELLKRAEPQASQEISLSFAQASQGGQTSSRVQTPQKLPQPRPTPMKMSEITKLFQHSDKALERSVKSLANAGKVGWVSDPNGRFLSFLVEAGTGTILLDKNDTEITFPARVDYQKTAPALTPLISILELPDFENYVPHMYIVPGEHVPTVGIGLQLGSVSEAKALPFVTGDVAEEPAENHEIEQNYKEVISNGGNYSYSYYGRFAKVYLSKNNARKSATNKLLDIISDGDLNKQFPDFDSFPVNAKIGILEWAYNLGGTKIRKNSNFPKFKQAVKSRDWTSAAMEHRRGGIPQRRNLIVSDLFLSAAIKEPLYISSQRKRISKVQ